MHTDPLAATLASVELGVPVTVDNLTMIPLLARQPREPKIDYIVLDEAMAAGEVEITEISDEGSVPDLRVINRGAKPVLILDGEELLGAKQNRVVNLTILVPAHAELSERSSPRVSWSERKNPPTSLDSRARRRI